MSRNKKILTALFVLSILIAKTLPFGIRINVSESLPYWVFISKKIDAIERDDYVSFSRSENKYPLVKQIVGIAGDCVDQIDGNVFVNGQNCGTVLSISKSGQRISPLLCECIPSGHVFVYASHPESFDSRYQEFGLVKIEEIKEKLWPIF